MPGALGHIAWLKKTNQSLATKDGKRVLVFELQVDVSDTSTMVAWARHFRAHYCLDALLDRYRKGTGKSRAEYLSDLVFPSQTDDFGPATRSGDFAEILVCDLLQGQFGYIVPRTRYLSKTVRNESTKGVDVIGLKIISGNADTHSPDDVLISFEAKAQLRSKTPSNRLQDALNDSPKDRLRLAESLNAMNRRLIDMEQFDEAAQVQRFQEPIGRPFIRRSGAAAVYSTSIYRPELIGEMECTGHENYEGLRLVVIHAADMMDLVHSIYERAAHEA